MSTPSSSLNAAAAQTPAPGRNMVLDFYNLKEQPFGVNPNPRFLYFSTAHREALASIQYGLVSGRGFTALIAEPGMGKTTLLFDFLTKTGNSARTVFLFQPQLTPRDFLWNLLDDLGIDHEATDVGQMQRKLNECLVRESRSGKQFVVVIDEAQNLDQNVLEVVRMLSNFETPQQKLIHLVLSGQPALAEMLASPPLVQLRQRISIVARLQPLNIEETRVYIDHRLRVAGYASKEALFTQRATRTVFQHSGGIPRNINNLCFNAMSLGCALKMKTIDADVVWEVVRDLDLRSLIKQPSEPPKLNAPTTKRRNRSVMAASSRTFRSSVFSGWRLKTALAMGLTAVTATTLILHYQRSRLDQQRPSTVFSSPSAQTSSGVNPVESPLNNADNDAVKTSSIQTVSTSSVSPFVSTESGSFMAPTFVVVQPDQDLFRICLELLGRYDEQTLDKIRELNPDLGDINQIKVGQKIRLPQLHVRHQGPRTVAANEQPATAKGSGKE